MVTPEILTDEEILRFGRSKRDGTINDAIGRQLCVVALRLGSPMMSNDDDIRAARQCICDALNRASKETP